MPGGSPPGPLHPAYRFFDIHNSNLRDDHRYLLRYPNRVINAAVCYDYKLEVIAEPVEHRFPVDLERVLQTVFFIVCWDYQRSAQGDPFL